MKSMYFFQDIERQFQENILHHFLHYNFFIRSSLNSEVSLLNVFRILPNQINYLHSNIEYVTVLYFYHNLLCICY